MAQIMPQIMAQPKAPSRYVLADKPGGVATHATEAGPAAPEELVEHLSRVGGRTLFVCHRLDKGTTGAIAFATSSEAAAELSALFARREVSKEYLFITDRAPSFESTTLRSHIEKQGSNFVSREGEIDAITHLRKLSSMGEYSLWAAKPETGRPHQIRLHAAGAGIPVLGDHEHGGTSFPVLCLHARSLEFVSGGETYSLNSPPPAYFEDLRLLSNRLFCAWLAAVDRRERWLAARAAAGADAAFETLRWIHTEGGPLRVEQLGAVFELQWFDEEPPTDTDWEDIRSLAATRGWKSWRLSLRRDRGRHPNERSTWESEAGLPEKWIAVENGLKFEFRANQGLSSGLFLDQRANRAWMREHARDREVLNLFCYTGGFSVAAAAGGAKKTVSVDLSKNFLEWTKTNFALNGLETAGHEFRAMDAREFLKWAAKKELRYDLVVCDPPSFGRGEKGVFRIEKDLPDLVSACAAVLKPGGKILLSCNFEKWTQGEFESVARKGSAGLALKPSPRPDWDFEMPREPRVMKSAFFEKI